MKGREKMKEKRKEKSVRKGFKRLKLRGEDVTEEKTGTVIRE